jgi:trehalose synthase
VIRGISHTSPMASTLGNTVEVLPLDPRRLEPIIGAERVAELLALAVDFEALLGARRIVNVNSTATGGGVAEMLWTLLGYTRGVGIAADWVVITGDPEFFAITKRIHNGLYGSPGDGGDLGATERAHYDRTIAANVEAVGRRVRSGDVVLVHDPQPAGLIAPLQALGARVIWRCHVGHDGSNEWTERAWEFIRPYVEVADAHVFSRAAFAPSWIDPAWMRVIPPSIDPFAPKNQDLTPFEVLALLSAAGIVAPDGIHPDARVRSPAQVVRDGPPVDPRAPLVVQVSRWDRIKDMGGVLAGFVDHVSAPDAHLALVGPAVSGVSDDPEGEQVWSETVAAWSALPRATRERVHLVTVPMLDPVENALVINAIQRHAAIVVQKSLAEGFGLTVAEAMWKSRPIVASAVGGIVDQVIDGETGILVQDPRDLESFGAAVERLLREPLEAERLGRNARSHIERHFLGDRHLVEYAALVASLVAAG